MNTRQISPGRAKGFSLVEIAVVLVIIAILATAVGVPLASQLETQRTIDTQRQLELAREAVYGFAMANGRLPCPAVTAAATAVESPVGGGACTQARGFLPATTLGLTGLDTNGFMVDAWNDGTANHRIAYAISTANSNALTKPMASKPKRWPLFPAQPSCMFARPDSPPRRPPPIAAR